jgi:hypothetical protein
MCAPFVYFKCLPWLTCVHHLDTVLPRCCRAVPTALALTTDGIMIFICSCRFNGHVTVHKVTKTCTCACLLSRACLHAVPLYEAEMTIRPWLGHEDFICTPTIFDQ